MFHFSPEKHWRPVWFGVAYFSPIFLFLVSFMYKIMNKHTLKFCSSKPQQSSMVNMWIYLSLGWIVFYLVKHRLVFIWVKSYNWRRILCLSVGIKKELTAVNQKVSRQHLIFYPFFQDDLSKLFLTLWNWYRLPIDAIGREKHTPKFLIADRSEIFVRYC